MSNTTEDDTMEEQNELNDLKKLMETQQKTLTETMSAMELKATALQEKRLNFLPQTLKRG